MTRENLLPFSLLAAFSADGRVYQSFGHYIAPGAGRLLLVPHHMAYGDRSMVVSGCPVPVEEVSALLDTPQDFPVSLKARDPLWRHLATIADDGWMYDFIAMAPGCRERLLRVAHGNGIRYGEVMR